jgi:hypothetical protein
MVRSRKTRPQWAEDFLAQLERPSAEELERREKALERALEIRERMDIRPLTTAELVRSVRDSNSLSD